VWAHPADETYLAGALMASAADHGQRVVSVAASAGEFGTSDPGTWPPARLAAVRRFEATAAMAILGVREHHILGMPDGRLADHDEAGTRHVGHLVDEIQPDTILTFDPTGITFHADHLAVHRWVTTAWEQRGRPGRLLYATSSVEHLTQFRALYEAWDLYMADRRPLGWPSERLAVHLQLNDAELDRKLAALRAMSTQTGPILARIDPAVYAAAVAEEAFFDATLLASWWPLAAQVRPSLRDLESVASTA
jgi:LmbE family N-acetylglucosaminyl deacetylase